MSEFSDRPFVAGSMTGLRSFKVDKYGRLQATQLAIVWTPGENVARCYRSLVGGGVSMSQMLRQMGMPSASAWAYGAAVVAESKPSDKPKYDPSPEHRVGKVDCTCGFYAYFDTAKNSYHNPGQLRGVIEGYGTVTVGTRGFRAQKAKLQALIIPPKKRTATTNRVELNYPDVPVFDGKWDALEAFPLTPPAVPSPGDDPDFWTRETL